MATNIHNLFHLTITFGIFAAFQSVFLRYLGRYFCGKMLLETPVGHISIKMAILLVAVHPH